jgi:hypothetical protein
MVDITLCTNEACLLRDNCRRAATTLDKLNALIYSPRQSYSKFEQNQDGTCDYQLKIKDENNG